MIKYGGAEYALENVPFLEIITQTLLNKIDVVPEIFAAIIIFISFCIVGKLLARFLQKVLASTPNLAPMSGFAKAIRVLFIILGIVTALGTVGINTNALVAALGFSGVAVGMAMKDAFTNSLYGVMIVLHKPFTLGDKISLGETTVGIVKSIDLRYTTIECENKTLKLIPNSKIFNDVITLYDPFG